MHRPPHTHHFASSSPLASSPPAVAVPSQLAPSSDGPTSDAGPSSPTSHTTRHQRTTPASHHRAYKSTSSRRQSLQFLTSPTGAGSGSTLRQQLLLSRPTRPPRVVPESENPFQVEYANGGMRDGVWEENTEEEERIILRRLEREQKLERERKEDSWIHDFGGGAAYEEEPEEELEPPTEFVYDPSEETQQPYTAFSSLLPQLPSLASSIKSSPRSSHAALDDDEEEEGDGDATMVDDQDSQEPSQLPPSSPPPLPYYGEGYENGDLEDELPVEELDPAVVEQRKAQFGQALLQADCPACKAAAPTISGSQEKGAKCVQCGWGIEISAVEELGRVFGLHGDLETHRPVFMWTEFTGTLVLCSACDEEFGA